MEKSGKTEQTALSNQLDEILSLLMNKIDKLTQDECFKDDVNEKLKLLLLAIDSNPSFFDCETMQFNQIQFFKMINDLINTYKITNEPLFQKCLEICYVFSTEDQLCAYFNENFNIVNDICEIILINTSLNDNAIITLWRTLLNITREYSVSNITHHVTNMVLHCVDRILENDFKIHYFEFISNLVRNNFDYTNDLIKTMDTKSQFRRVLFTMIGNEKTSDPRITILVLMIATKLFSSLFIKNTSATSKLRFDAIECGLNYLFNTLDEYDETKKTNKAIVACSFLHEFFKCNEIRSLVEQDEKLTSVAIILKLNTALLHQSLLKNKKLLLKLLQLFVEMSKNENYAKKFKQTLFNTEHVLKDIKKMKRTFNISDHLSASKIDLINVYKLLSNFDENSHAIFMQLCDLLRNIFKTIGFNEIKDKNVHRLLNTFMNNFVQFKETNDFRQLHTNKSGIVKKCFVQNLIVIDYFLDNFQFNEVFDSSLIDEINFKQSIMDLIGCTITTLGDDHFPKENANNCMLNNQLMLVSAHVILNMADKKNNQKEYPDDDDQNDMDETKCLFNYLKSECFLKCLLFSLNDSKNLDTMKLAFNIVFKLKSLKQFSLDNYLKLVEAKRLHLSQSNDAHANESCKVNNVISKITNLSIASTTPSSDCETTTNDLLQYYELVLQEHMTYENDLIKNIKLYSSRFANLKYENSLLLNKLNNNLRLQQTFKDNTNKLLAEKELEFNQKLAQHEQENEKLRKNLKEVQEMLESKTSEFEQTEKEYDESIEKLQKILGDEKNARQILQDKLSDLKAKLNDFDKIKQKQKEYEVLLSEKDNEIVHLKSDNEKVKGLLSYVKNFNI